LWHGMKKEWGGTFFKAFIHPYVSITKIFLQQGNIYSRNLNKWFVDSRFEGFELNTHAQWK
jgi:hypothetical protein